MQLGFLLLLTVCLVAALVDAADHLHARLSSGVTCKARCPSPTPRGLGAARGVGTPVQAREGPRVAGGDAPLESRAALRPAPKMRAHLGCDQAHRRRRNAALPSGAAAPRPLADRKAEAHRDRCTIPLS